MKKLFAVLLSLLMVFTLVGCNKNSGSNSNDGASVVYTYHTYSSSLANNWNPHTWETNGDSAILDLLQTPICTYTIEDSVNQVYQIEYAAATSIEDVTASNQADLSRFAVVLPEGQTPETTTEGYVYELKLNPDVKWQDGTQINADTYIESMKKLLDPTMQNYRANNYYSGEYALVGAEDYYYSGTTAYLDNALNAGYALADLVAGDDGQFTTPEGEKVFVALTDALDWLQGNSLTDYVDAYGDQYFGVEDFEALKALADEAGRVALNEESLAHIQGVITAVADWGETAEDAKNYLVYAKEYPVVNYDDVVGCYKVDDYTIHYVQRTQTSFADFIYSQAGGNWLVYDSKYEENKDTSGSLVTTSYGSSMDKTMSFGPYILTSLEEGKQMVFVKNPYYFAYSKDEATGRLVGKSNFKVDGQEVEVYQADKYVIDVMTDDAAKQAFLKGELDDWTPSASDLPTYTLSDKLYKAPETYTMRLFFCDDVNALKAMDESKGNTNSVVMSNVNFRKAFSLAIDRADWVTATQAYVPSYGILNSLYYYNIFEDPTSSYRDTDQAMQAVCNLYGVEFGAGTPYATLEEAYNSINGYNLTEAKELMAVACQELVAAGLYKEGDPIHIRMGYKKGAFDSSDNQQIALFNEYINAAADGSGFGTITLEGVDNVENRYADTAAGEFAIGYGAWGGAAFSPFTMFRVYMDPDYVSIHEAGSWNPANYTFTLNVNGQEITKTAKEWANSMSGVNEYATADFDTKLSILSQLEEQYLGLYHCIPLASTTVASLTSYKLDNYTKDYNIMYGFGGLELVQFHYTDAEWADYIKNNSLSYE